MDSFLMSLRKLWLELHQSLLQHSYWQTRNDLPCLVNLVLCVQLNNIFRVIHFGNNLIESELWFVEIIDSLKEFRISAFR